MLVSPCLACQYGDHDRHVGVVSASVSGLIGSGQECDCEGECRTRRDPRVLPPEYSPGHEAAAIEYLSIEDDTVQLAKLTAERDALWRLFNRLDAAVSHHKKADRFKEDHDEALYAARDRIMRDAAEVGS